MALITPPEPDFVTTERGSDVLYAWRCDAMGIIAYGNTKIQAKINWLEAYRDEKAAERRAA